ncbi:MAG: ribosome-associated translation inhibitor RaiA [Devosiaceae bacterium]|nr:ribosome-associated translation inhibitor RaiA [Devosiaceae bacterium]
MNLRVSGKNMDVGDALRTKAQDRLDEVISKYFDGGFEGHLTFEHEGSGYRSDMVLHLDTGAVLRAHAQARDAISSFQTTADHIEKRLRRYKRKLKSRRKKGDSMADMIAKSYVLDSPDTSDEVSEDFSPPIIAQSASSLSRMSVGEAVMELDLSHSDVQVFLNAGHGGMNVVYRRADGNIVWIDPELP